MRTRLLALLALLLMACGHRPLVSVPAAPGPSHAELGAADALVRAGCLDCLASAYRTYDRLREVPEFTAEATRGAIDAGVLIAVRERELGIEESGTLPGARALAAALPDPSPAQTLAFDVVDTLPIRFSASNRIVASDAQLEQARRVASRRAEWTDALEAAADKSALDAYMWLAFSCLYGDPRAANVEALAEHIPTWRDTPLLRFKLATCRELQMPALQRLLAADSRFVEVRYNLALKAILEGRLEDADTDLEQAYAFRSQWPAVTFTIADVALTGEDFARAADFYERTLALVPNDPEALVGRARTLTYLGRYADAIAAANAVLALQQRYIGEALYWRAMGETELGRHDEAWQDVQEAERRITNADVPKLAGIVESRRGERAIARTKLELAHERNRFDCQTLFYLGSIVAEDRDWPRTAAVFTEAASCFEGWERGLDAEIARIERSDASPERKARLIGRRQQQRMEAARDLVTCWFNLAAAEFNLARYDAARQHAEQAADDARFADRVRELLRRLPE